MDLVLHFLVGAALATLPPQPYQGLGLAILAGVAKEVADRRPGGTGFNTRDLAWTALGGATVTLIRVEW